MVTVSQTLTWDEAVREYLLHIQAVRAKKTVLFYRVQLSQLVRWCEDEKIGLSSFGKRHLDRYLVQRQQDGRAPGTLQHDAVAAKAFFRWCARNDILDRSPLAEYQVVNAPEPERYMPTDDEIMALLTAVRDFFDAGKNPKAKYLTPALRAFLRDRNLAILFGLLDTACRIGEVCSLTLDDVREKERQVTFRHTKGREPRTVPVSQEWLDVLGDWKKQRAKVMANVPTDQDEGWLFLSEYGTRMDESGFLRAVNRYLAFAKLNSKITLHSLRRYSLNSLSKVDILVAQRIAGHKETKTTLAYTKLDPGHLRAVHEHTGVVRGLVTSKRPPRKKLI